MTQETSFGILLMCAALRQKISAMFLLIATVIFCLRFVHSGKENVNCSSNPCSCCRDGECTGPDRDPFPCKGCIDGYTGPSCYETCPQSCVSCTQLFYEYDTEKICYRCENGYYNGRYKDIEDYPLQHDCSLTCTENCAACSSYYNCAICKENHYLIHDRDCTECSLYCKKCLHDKGCVACIDGYVLNGKECQPCSANCKECKLPGECSDCYSGYYLSDKLCHKCPTGCLTCAGPEECDQCHESFILTGSTCSKACGNCQEGTACNITTGYCLESCLEGLSGENCSLPCDLICLACERVNQNKCVTCAGNRYGPSCENHCSTNCLSNICNDIDGICANGCDTGYWGRQCEHECSKQCKDRKCEGNDGVCSTGCVDNYKGKHCDCPVNCECQTDGICSNCLWGYGDICDVPCSEGCLGTICDSNSGACLNGCLPEYTGTFCSEGLVEPVNTGAKVWIIILVVVVVVFATTVALVLIFRKRILLTMRRARESLCRKEVSSKNKARESDASSYDRSSSTESKETTRLLPSNGMSVDVEAQQFVPIPDLISAKTNASIPEKNYNTTKSKRKSEPDTKIYFKEDTVTVDTVDETTEKQHENTINKPDGENTHTGNGKADKITGPCSVHPPTENQTAIIIETDTTEKPVDANVKVEVDAAVRHPENMSVEAEVDAAVRHPENKSVEDRKNALKLETVTGVTETSTSMENKETELVRATTEVKSIITETLESEEISGKPRKNILASMPVEKVVSLKKNDRGNGNTARVHFSTEEFRTPSAVDPEKVVHTSDKDDGKPALLYSPSTQSDWSKVQADETKTTEERNEKESSL